jgi:hypothetical protein
MKKTVFALVMLAAIAGTATAEPRQSAAAANPHASQFVNKVVVLDVIQSPNRTFDKIVFVDLVVPANK